jgi:hypothetical protein
MELINQTSSKTETEATCLLCKEKEETMEHFILGCRCLETIRNPLLHELVTKLKECDIKQNVGMLHIGMFQSNSMEEAEHKSVLN